MSRLRRLVLTFHRIFDHEAVDLDKAKIEQHDDCLCKDLYEVLGIPEDADENTIKKA